MIPYHEYDQSSKVHLYCVWIKKPKGRKTAIYSIRKDKIRFYQGAIELGKIKWYGAFRQFAFYPAGNTYWSKGCLEIINKFLKKLNDRHRKNLRRKS